MKLVLSLVTLALSGIATSHAASNAELPREAALDALNRAQVLCAAPNNPYLNGLKPLKAHLFENVRAWRRLGERYEIRAKAVQSPSSFNRAVMAPDRVVGEVKISYDYRAKANGDRPLTCRVVLLR